MNVNRINVLLVEDDTDSIFLMNIHLNEACGESLRFQMECANRVEKAIELLDRGDYDVVLLDLMLPDSQGLETLTRVRAHAANLPIVVMTNLNDEDLGIEAVAHGAQDFLLKDKLDSRMLRRAISYAIERNRLMASWENIIENAADGMVVVDVEGIVRYVNPSAEALFRRKAAQMLGKPFGFPVTPDRTTVLSIPLEGGGEKIAEMRVTEVEWRKYRARLASIRDITDLRRLEQLKGEIRERRRVDMFREEWLSTVTHEFKSPLGIVRAAHSTLRKAGPLSEKQQKMLGIAHKNVERIAKLVLHLRDLSGSMACKTKLNRRRLSAVRLIQETIQAFQLMERFRRVHLQTEIPVDLPSVHADADMFAQILSNLLDNALEHCRGKIVIQAQSVESVLSPAEAAQGEEGRSIALLGGHKGVQITVADDGPGMREKDLSNSNLSLCKDLVGQLQGKIWIDSLPGQGTRVRFTLPQYE